MCCHLYFVSCNIQQVGSMNSVYSMGGAIAVKAAAANAIPSLVALSVIDVVEGLHVYFGHCMYAFLIHMIILKE